MHLRCCFKTPSWLRPAAKPYFWRRWSLPFRSRPLSTILSLVSPRRRSLPGRFSLGLGPTERVSKQHLTLFRCFPGLVLLAAAWLGGGAASAQSEGQKPSEEKPKVEATDTPRPSENKEGEIGKKAEGKKDGKSLPPIILEERRKRARVPEIPRDQLPSRTRKPPDPKTNQYVLGKVYIRIGERVRLMKGAEYVPKVPVVTEYLSEYFRRAGYDVVPTAATADYRVEGSMRADYKTVLKFRDEIVAWKYGGSVTVQVFEGERQREEITVPDVYRENAKNETSCVLDLRRYMAKTLHDKLFSEGKVFPQLETIGLLRQLSVDPLEAEKPVSGNEIIARLADIGLPAVPYLLETLTDTRTVLAATEYPGLENLDDLKSHHVADKALEEIFQKISRMNLKTNSHQRFVIIRGWENEWRRFCPPFRESPQYKRRQEARRAKKATSTPKEAG